MRGLRATVRPGTAYASQEDDLRGWVRHLERWGDFHDLTGALPRCDIDPAVVSLYRSLVGEMNRAGHRVAVVFPPVHAVSLPQLNCVAQLPPIFASLAPPGNTYLDYHRHPMGSEDRYFYNKTHLNAEGAEAFTALLGKDLVRFLGEQHP
jgi:hypothetical protein